MKKLWSIIRWAFYIAIGSVGIGGLTAFLVILKFVFNINIHLSILLSSLVFSSYVMYPILYLFRNTWVAHTKPFWYYFDDEDGNYGTTWFRVSKNLKYGKFITAYRWLGFRNSMWNLQTTLVPIKGKEVIISSKGRLTRNNKEISLTEVAVLKYVDADGNFMDNAGDFLSLKYSILGWTFIWFKIENKLYWRYSLTKNVFNKEIKFLKITFRSWNPLKWRIKKHTYSFKMWVEIQMGVGYRYTWRAKYNNVETYQNKI